MRDFVKCCLYVEENTSYVLTLIKGFLDIIGD